MAVARPIWIEPTKAPTTKTSSIDHLPSSSSQWAVASRVRWVPEPLKIQARARSLITGKTIEKRKTIVARIQLPSCHRLSMPPQIE